ncbi:putative d-arabinono- -lactone oxidase protein [Lasiodiplodia theobromae]|uniref:D-arabinono-1,4-lactone oxidase n=1 Tax=Lasiodiplodia theobromae TaxID=45133 RepID=A0A5N5D5Z5_9PEZI|nr:D-arabinono-1,4-lactone oxidase [Lasiodiplodia theobromae]KAB2572975.1 putative D-arabinono-1,4-lactone oxidase [Lasiodiplodia theobromae]KAF4545333.1 D-arabinono-1,4-lactone oxidase [Lasiodiplodia theobromae]KAF9639072.1 putative d-arabinono- -lactone oxidase protein [Lasiodiplodia theobromae]
MAADELPARVQDELTKLDPAVPFRASKTHIHHTWARTFHSYPELYIRPQSLAEIQKAVVLARRCRRRITLVGCGHSPSDLTCTSAWMMNLDKYNKVVRVDRETGIVQAQAGIRLYQLNEAALEHGLTMPNLGSINQQSIVGAMATGTHGSSLQHGLLSGSVRSLRLVLANGSVVLCSAEQNVDLFRAALVSLGALGIIVEVEYQMIPHAKIEWEQTLKPLSYVLAKWDRDLWTKKEFTRVWWCPYMKRAIIWSAEKTDKPLRAAETSWYGGSVGFHTYHILLWIANYIPPILPAIEWFVFGMQYGFSDDTTTSAVEPMHTGLLMNCLYSQFVNEWALPLHKGPEAITRLSAWIHGDEETARIPFSSRGVWVHCPIEVRVADTSIQTNQPRPFLDPSCADGPTLYLNATLYRPFHADPPCHARYYEAFEWLMRDLGARPHWAKNFRGVDHGLLSQLYGADLDAFLAVRQRVDPDGMFVGAWHRRVLLPHVSELPRMALEEREVARRDRRSGGKDWIGEQAVWRSPRGSSSAESHESFDVLHAAEAEASQLLEAAIEDGNDEPVNLQFHGSAVRGFTGTRVFDKM